MRSLKMQEPADCCLVLMFKSPERSKRRLAEEIGPLASKAAHLLLNCAAEDLAGWPGPVCLAPAERGDERGLEDVGGTVLIVEQRGANLGERINAVNTELWSRGIRRQLFIGIDCPELGQEYLREAAAALDEHDAVFGPAVDGGAVLMASRRRWPELRELAWSSARLLEELTVVCRAEGWTTASMAARADVDSAADLLALGPKLRADERAARRALGAWVDAHAGRF